MKKIGLIGGMGPESTIDYYRGIIKAFHDTYKQTGYPEIAIESCDLREILFYSGNDQWDKMVNVLALKANLLQQAGCDFAAIASNTPHKVFNEIQEQTPLPLISIVETTHEFAQEQGLKKLCLLGTGFTMRSDFYQKVFHKSDIELIVPNPEEINYIHDKIFSELEYGIINLQTRQEFITITNRMVNENNSEGVILGCTELPLIMKADDFPFAYLDTTQIHIAKIVTLCK